MLVCVAPEPHFNTSPCGSTMGSFPQQSQCRSALISTIACLRRDSAVVYSDPSVPYSLGDLKDGSMNGVFFAATAEKRPRQWHALGADLFARVKRRLASPNPLAPGLAVIAAHFHFSRRHAGRDRYCGGPIETKYAQISLITNAWHLICGMNARFLRRCDSFGTSILRGVQA